MRLFFFAAVLVIAANLIAESPAPSLKVGTIFHCYQDSKAVCIVAIPKGGGSIEVGKVSYRWNSVSKSYVANKVEFKFTSKGALSKKIGKTTCSLGSPLWSYVKFSAHAGVSAVAPATKKSKETVIPLVVDTVGLSLHKKYLKWDDSLKGYVRLASKGYRQIMRFAPDGKVSNEHQRFLKKGNAWVWEKVGKIVTLPVTWKQTQ